MAPHRRSRPPLVPHRGTSSMTATRMTVAKGMPSAVYGPMRPSQVFVQPSCLSSWATGTTRAAMGTINVKKHDCVYGAGAAHAQNTDRECEQRGAHDHERGGRHRDHDAVDEVPRKRVVGEDLLVVAECEAGADDRRVEDLPWQTKRDTHHVHDGKQPQHRCNDQSDHHEARPPALELVATPSPMPRRQRSEACCSSPSRSNSGLRSRSAGA